MWATSLSASRILASAFVGNAREYRACIDEIGSQPRCRMAYGEKLIVVCDLQRQQFARFACRWMFRRRGRLDIEQCLLQRLPRRRLVAYR